MEYNVIMNIWIIEYCFVSTILGRISVAGAFFCINGDGITYPAGFYYQVVNKDWITCYKSLIYIFIVWMDKV